MAFNGTQSSCWLKRLLRNNFGFHLLHYDLKLKKVPLPWHNMTYICDISIKLFFVFNRHGTSGILHWITCFIASHSFLMLQLRPSRCWLLDLQKLKADEVARLLRRLCTFVWCWRVPQYGYMMLAMILEHGGILYGDGAFLCFSSCDMFGSAWCVSSGSNASPARLAELACYRRWYPIPPSSKMVVQCIDRVDGTRRWTEP